MKIYFLKSPSRYQLAFHLNNGNNVSLVCSQCLKLFPRLLTIESYLISGENSKNSISNGLIIFLIPHTDLMPWIYFKS
jgi:hypothetical protein